MGKLKFIFKEENIMTLEEFEKASTKSYLLHDARNQLDLRIQSNRYSKKQVRAFVGVDMSLIEIYRLEEIPSIRGYYKYLCCLKYLLEECLLALHAWQ